MDAENGKGKQIVSRIRRPVPGIPVTAVINLGKLLDRFAQRGDAAEIHQLHQAVAGHQHIFLLQIAE
ncbi:hypothetical protein D3C81_2050710 [compost metagenome]